MAPRVNWGSEFSDLAEHLAQSRLSGGKHVPISPVRVHGKLITVSVPSGPKASLTLSGNP